MSKYLSNSVEETKEIASNIIKEAISERAGGALVLALEGELGAGKTHFAKGVAQYLGIKRNITSPTFIISKKYRIPVHDTGFSYFYHLDCYRISDPEDILELEWKEIIADAGNIVLVEWAERIKKIIPKDATHIRMKTIDENTREIVVG